MAAKSIPNTKILWKGLIKTIGKSPMLMTATGDLITFIGEAQIRFTQDHKEIQNNCSSSKYR